MTMSKWKCEICNSDFNNYQAQGFDNKIYCPLCYFKELYRKTELERERLNNIIKELESYLLDYDESKVIISSKGVYYKNIDILDKLKELKEK